MTLPEQDPVPPYERSVFGRYRSRAFGAFNAQNMWNPHWDFMVRTGLTPYRIRRHFGCDSPLTDGGLTDAYWCFDRFGSSRTVFPDGRLVYIGGEHEEGYDPDFCIYNDVTIVTPAAGRDFATLDAGKVEIRGYPESCFPPVGFHSATHVGSYIYVIGGHGYGEMSGGYGTPVFRIHTATWIAERVVTSGDMPGWITSHHASVDAANNSILIHGGRRWVAAEGRMEDQRGCYALSLATGHWHCVRSPGRYVRFFVRPPYEHCDDLLAAASSALSHMEGVKYSPGAWTGTRSEPSSPVLEIRDVFITVTDQVDRLQLDCLGDFTDQQLRELLIDICNRLDATTGLCWILEDDTDRYGLRS